MSQMSFRTNLDSIVKRICLEEGLKQYAFLEKAVEEYIKKHYPQYLMEKQK